MWNFPDVRGIWGYRPGCSCQHCEQRIPDMLRCRPSSSIPTKEFCRCASDFCQTHCWEPLSWPREIRLTPQVSWLASGINAPEGSCFAEEFAVVLPGGCLYWFKCCLLHVISVGVCVLFVGFTFTSDVFLSVGRLFETFVWDHRRCAPMMLCLFAARFARRPERLFTFCKSR